MKKNLIFILVFIFLTGYALPEKKKEIKKQRKNLVKKAIDWKMKGLRAYSSRDFEGAIEYYSKALEVDPKDSDAYEFLGQLYSIRKNFDKAIINYSMVLKFEPKNLNVLLGRGNIYLYYLKKPDKALKNYSKIIEIDPKHSMAFNNRSGVYLQYRHELELAFSDLSKSIELDPKYADAYGNRACVYFFKGDFKKAEKDLVAFLKYGSNNNPYSKYRRLWKYLATKRSGGAENGELSRFVSKLDDSDWINAVLMLFNIQKKRFWRAVSQKQRNKNVEKL